ncbi:MAG: sigma-70 family RNA polymerase sigma factor [Saprospiraceae bacterium]|nr:sigma-70 family RNA polymerase sigma factor [Saprospiraceae bacterium]MCB0626213.1 sigma-70 family RNA polymerase sigma factor [Saprospiraceae bacterium]MCB0675961.1 sigma-70 family RNA polymerase sigma factor [Saprospiraceae bacterium]MCB0684681.1 sigma-70 family RNA polymerase sigma factor [Saprospiraceae bacterium]
MFSNLQISRTLVKKDVRMEHSGKTVSEEAIRQEWLEIQAAQRDRTQFRPLYNRYYESIFRFVYRRTADEDLTADLCSQVFLKAMTRLDGYQFQGVPFSAWLFRIASNEVAQHYRKVNKDRVVSVEEEQLSDLADEIEEELGEDHRQALLGALDDLPEKDLELIELRFFEQRPFKEIAEILDITESNAKVRTYRILERLKKKMPPQR